MILGFALIQINDKIKLQHVLCSQITALWRKLNFFNTFKTNHTKYSKE